MQTFVKGTDNIKYIQSPKINGVDLVSEWKI